MGCAVGVVVRCGAVAVERRGVWRGGALRAVRGCAKIRHSFDLFARPGFPPCGARRFLGRARLARLINFFAAIAGAEAGDYGGGLT